MAYLTLDGLKKRIPYSRIIELTDDDGDGAPDTGVVDQAIADADSKIDGYCAAQYTVPLTSPVPAVIARCSADLTVWYLYSRQINRSIPDATRKRYEDAIYDLEAISEGKLLLQVDAPATKLTTGVVVKKTAEDRVFSRDILKDY